MTEDCRSPEEIDAEWMTEALETGGLAQGAVVERLVLEGFVGTGQMARNARFSLHWDTPGRPESVVGKFPAEDPTSRAAGFEMGGYKKEWLFYSALNATIGTRTPECWVTRFDEPGQDFVLIMEDLNRSIQGDQLAGLTPDQASIAVEEAAKLHAPHWGNHELELILESSHADSVEKLERFYPAVVEGSLERLGDRIDLGAVQLIRDLVPLVGKWWTTSETPSTLTHQDYRPDNFMFAAETDAPPLVVVDWQTAAYGLSANDIAYVLGGGFEPEHRAAVERDLVLDYAKRIRSTGIHYDDDTCWQDYRIGSIWGVIITAVAAMMAEQTERGDEMLSLMLLRHTRHALDLDALSLVG